MNIRLVELRFIPEVVEPILVEDVETCVSIDDNLCFGTVYLGNRPWKFGPSRLVAHLYTYRMSLLLLSSWVLPSQIV